MSVIKFVKTIRDHWKKTTFALGLVAYGVSYSVEKYKINELMRAYCAEAVKYGDIKINASVPPKRILILLNPAANKRSAEKTFQKYCEPILHLGGYLVDIVKTDSEGHATRYVEELDTLPDAILVAGGDGTASEAVTGLMRRRTHKNCPIGILPLGRTNTVAAKFYNFSSEASNLEEVHQLANSSIAVLRGKTTKKNIMKIQPMDLEEEKSVKPIFALGSLHWGAFRDAKTLQDKYWYIGPWREYASTLFHAFGNDLTWSCEAKLVYTPPCPGCSNCLTPTVSTGRWWSRFIPKFKLGQQSHIAPDRSHVVNKECSDEKSVEINPTEFILSTSDEQEITPRLTVEVEDSISSGMEFIKESWRRIKSQKVNTKKLVEGRTIQLIPHKVSTDDKEVFYSIDNEAYEVRPVTVSIVPKAIDMFTL